jgi:hypothetical protein
MHCIWKMEVEMSRYHFRLRSTSVMSAAVVLFFIALFLGQVAAQQYNCGSPSTGHCYAIADFGGGCMSIPPSRGCLSGFRTAITIKETLPGDVFLNTEMWLTSSNTGGWIEVGYRSLASDARPHYFWAQNPSNGWFLQYDLGEIPQQDFSSVARFEISRLAHMPWPVDKDLFRVSINSLTTNFSTLFFNDMWLQAGHGVARIGQELAGSNGAYSPQQIFYDFWYLDANGSGWHIDTQKDVNFISDNPPYGSWPVDPLPAADVAGIFASRCCQPPSGLAAESLPQVAAPTPAFSLLGKRQVTGVQPVQPETSGNVPTSREAELRKYALEAPIPKLEDRQDRTITRFDCSLTGRDLDALLSGAMTGISPDRQVCYIELDGAFILYGPPESEQKTRRTFSFSKAIEVFDAATGDLLLSGGRP